MWSETAFLVGAQAIDDLIDDDVTGLLAYPGIKAVTLDSGRHLVCIRFDSQRWTALQLTSFLDELGWEWQPIPVAAA